MGTSNEEGWPAKADAARLHFVSGKGGTGKTTVAAALALALAAGGRRVLLVEVEGRQGIAQLFDVPQLPPQETRVASADGGGEVYALAIDIETAFLEYLEMFYNLGFAGRAMRKIGAIEFATTIAPGLRDVLLTGKVKECVVRTDKKGNRIYDEIVVDSPPTGRIGNFLDVTKAMADLAKGGPVRSQSEGVVRLLHSADTVVHLVTLLEALPVQETADAVRELEAADLRLGTVIVNRTEPTYLPAETLESIAEGEIDAVAIQDGLAKTGITLSEADFAGLLTESIEHASTLSAQVESATTLDELDVAQMSLPMLADGVDLGGLYELAAKLAEQGVR
ncbi:AAA family ATPase [Rhodococcus sp. ARC_M12]|uniref:ArsA family ATPase n=1 Tax=unclassified Rhodococcus (in: high G+C Gram-positive bacteria) TaxID=192944 RepID=UPI001FB2ECE7|nr:MULTISPECIES: ArsA-related P-loop ATPase [unclassified Rhodococcus (in: high G+C Gram-positive bacteria)]MCJ0894625.1 AAA family ATPase [Rhodococcus sp. ARC_M5]MCJ0980402.1 AAA family ATPase [Rhodococcus sp. ARC_M12]